MIVALLLLSALALVSGSLHRYGEHPKKNSPYHPLEHNSDYQDDDDDQKSGDSIHHNASVYKKDYKFYDSWSKSEIEPKRNEPLFVARTLQTQTKKYIKNRLHAGDYRKQVNWKAYCEGNTQQRCELFVCYATQAIVDSKQFGKHIKHTKKCPASGKYPSLALTKNEKNKTKKNEQYRVINPTGFLHWMKAQYTKSKKLCHKTKHTTDDRCKAETACLTLEIFAETWPTLFAMENCNEAYFMTRDPRSPKTKLLNHSDYKDFTRLKGRFGKNVPLFSTDKSSLSTRFKDHMRNHHDQKYLSHDSEKKSGRSHRMSGKH